MSPNLGDSPGWVHTASDDEALLRALRDGDEQVFSELVERWSGVMLRLALTQVKSRAIAEEIVQEAWLTVVRSLDRYERRSSLRTWVLGIVANLARSRGRAERRSIARSSSGDGSAVDPSRFLGAGLRATTLRQVSSDFSSWLARSCAVASSAKVSGFPGLAWTNSSQICKAARCSPRCNSSCAISRKWAARFDGSNAASCRR